MRPDNQNTLTHQSANTKNAPRGPLHDPVTIPIDYSLYLTLKYGKYGPFQFSTTGKKILK